MFDDVAVRVAATKWSEPRAVATCSHRDYVQQLEEERRECSGQRFTPKGGAQPSGAVLRRVLYAGGRGAAGRRAQKPLQEHSSRRVLQLSRSNLRTTGVTVEGDLAIGTEQPSSDCFRPNAGESASGQAAASASPQSPSNKPLRQ